MRLTKVVVIEISIVVELAVDLNLVPLMVATCNRPFDYIPTGYIL